MAKTRIFFITDLHGSDRSFRQFISAARFCKATVLDKGDGPGKIRVVTYCQSGYRATHSWLTLTLIGFENLKNYLGSWH
jgi:3-mercaptopyruvate sulfurtransferase SseA